MKKNVVPATSSSGPKESSFFQDVWDVVKQVPQGRITTYGAIANYLGTKMSARMVGWAMNASGTAPFEVPAQRVVNRQGLLTGKVHFNPPSMMQELLEKEGVTVEDDKVKDFAILFWDPAVELKL